MSISEKLPILFRDENYIVIHKFSGLLVHSSKEDRFEKRFALQMLRDQIGSRVYPLHRLDKSTSGALMFATSSEAARLMGEEFKNGRIEKKYLAIVRGHFLEKEISVDYQLKQIQDRRSRQLGNDKPPQEAQTLFRVLSTAELIEPIHPHPTARYSLVEAQPLTGRKHQIRRHLKHLSHPIVGDVNYGVGVHNQLFRTKFDSHRLLLASTSLKFKDPYSKKEICVKAPLEQSFQKVIDQLGWTL